MNYTTDLRDNYETNFLYENTIHGLPALYEITFRQQ